MQTLGAADAGRLAGWIRPITGWTDREGFLVAAVHTSGIQLVPKTGDIIVRQLADSDPHGWNGCTVTQTPFFSQPACAEFQHFHLGGSQNTV